MQADPSYEGFRTTQSAIVIYVMVAISTIAQTIIARSEYNSMMGATSLKEHFDAQNIVDTIAIQYTWVYNAMRLILPSPTFIKDDFMIKGSLISLQHAMPILHTLMLVLMFGQGI